MLVKISEYIFGVKELNHGDSNGHVDRVDVIAVDERVERLSRQVEMLFGLYFELTKVFLAEELFEVFDRLRAYAQTCDGL